MDDLECLNCGEVYPPASCRWRCPSCGFKDSCCEGAPQKVFGRKFKNEVKYREYDLYDY